MLDGTTTALELEGGTVDVDRWYDARAGTSIINHGVSIGHDQVRMQVMHDPGKDTPMGPAKSRAGTEAELAAIVSAIDHGLRRGAVAAGMLIEFTPAATPWEIVEVFRVAASHRAAVHVHMRALAEPYYFLETEEIIAASAATGAPAHMSTTRKRSIETARARRAAHRPHPLQHQVPPAREQPRSAWSRRRAIA